MPKHIISLINPIYSIPCLMWIASISLTEKKTHTPKIISKLSCQIPGSSTRVIVDFVFQLFAPYIYRYYRTIPGMFTLFQCKDVDLITPILNIYLCCRFPCLRSMNPGVWIESSEKKNCTAERKICVCRTI